ncbi:hypothetical protein [Actinacidiphila sp. bgisy160]|uniref:hypothetical protein n=1 Tax=Actinacidiphila sp. bgisy160 TaxID=3413796 RepID=UPI003D75C5BC
MGGHSAGRGHHLAQNFLFRPMPGHDGYRTAVPGRYLTGAATRSARGTTRRPASSRRAVSKWAESRLPAPDGATPFAGEEIELTA